MTPTIGRILHYRLSKEEADKTNQRRADAKANVEAMRADRPGFQAHAGNVVQASEVVPLIVVQVWPEDRVNGQALLDGNDSLWVLSAKEGDGPGTWAWPPRV